MSAPVSTRRGLFRSLLLGGGVASVVGGAAGLAARRAAAAPLALRPPGARPEEEFLARCLRCGACVNACPYRCLRLAPAADGDAAWATPHFVPRESPCRMCRDIPCAKACPSGALDAGFADVDRARMGLAVLSSPDTCLSVQGLRCEACYRACPLIGKALRVECTHQPRTGRHAIFTPVVDSAHCTGCGACERVCITPAPSIRVFPRERASGAIGAHYRFGWREAPLAPPAPAPAAAAPGEAGGLDYLNGGDAP